MSASSYNLSVTKGLSYTNVITPEDSNHQCVSYTGVLPPGLSLSFSAGGNASLFGTPITAGGGTYDFVIVENNTSSTGAPGSIPVTVTVVDPSSLPPPVISCSGATATPGGGTLSLPAGEINLLFSTTNSPIDGSGAWVFSFPSGFSNSGGGYGAALAGAGALTAGSYSIVMSFYNTAYSGGPRQTTNYVLALTVTPALPVISVSSSSSLNGKAGTSLSAQFNVQTYAGAVSWAATGLPAGCVMNPSTGLVSGTPMVAGTYSATISATNSVGTATFTAGFVIGASSTTSTTTPGFEFLLNDPTLLGVLIETTTGVVTLSRSTLKRGTTGRFCLVFLAFGAVSTPPDAGKISMGIRMDGKFSSEYLFSSPSFSLVAASGSDPAYLLGEISITGHALAQEFAALGDSESALTLMSDFKWQTAAGKECLSNTFTFQVEPAVTV